MLGHKQGLVNNLCHTVLFIFIFGQHFQAKTKAQREKWGFIFYAVLSQKLKEFIYFIIFTCSVRAIPKHGL